MYVIIYTEDGEITGVNSYLEEDSWDEQVFAAKDDGWTELITDVAGLSVLWK